MFDRATDVFIRAVPSLDGLDRDRLPMELTEAFAKIVSLRVRLETAGGLTEAQLAEIHDQIDRLQRLANTYETLACLNEDDAVRRPCAFVAATAHQLLYRASGIGRPTEAKQHLKREGISPQIAALLLFFVAGAFPDAAEVASHLSVEMQADAENLLVRAIVSLAQGRLDEIVALPPYEARSDLEESLEAQATNAMWRTLYDGVRMLATDLLVGPDRRRDSTRAFRLIRSLAIQAIDPTTIFAVAHEAGVSEPTIYEVFGGPHHLATLLNAGAGVLLERAITQISPPSMEVDNHEWHRFLEKIAQTRPCLWPNHLDAIKQGFLEVGTSAAISFPTGSGKSTLVQLKIEVALLREKRALFLVPTHALVDQVRVDLQKVFSRSKVNISPLMDDLGNDAEARIDVMTPERCLAKLGIDPDFFDGLGLVIFDECHLLHPRDDDDDRRSLDAMLCLLNLLSIATTADVVLLSAMMANAIEMSEWLASFGNRRSLALDMDWKPTRQARGCIVYQLADVNALKQILIEERATAEEAAKKKATKKPNQKKWSGKPSSNVNQRLIIPPYALFSLRHTWITQSSQDYCLERLLGGEVNLSCNSGQWGWYLTANRNKVSAALASGYAACGIRTMVLAQTARDLPSLAATAAGLLHGKRTPVVLLPNEQELADLAAEELGGAVYAYLPIQGLVAIHHGMMLPFERRLSERLFGRKEGVFVLAVSPTLAQGVNLPADAIIIAGDDRWDIKADARAALAAHEVLNAAGRAGRAGSSALGIVLVVPGGVVAFDQSANRVEQRWFDLQERVFSKSDQCLEIRDPVQKWLDRLQQRSTEQPMDQATQYFLTRLPVDSAAVGEAPRRFLSKTLAAYHARKNGKLEEYSSLVEHVVSLRAKYSGHTGSWHDGVSATTGVPVDTVRELDAALSRDPAPDRRTVGEWISWWFSWLREAPFRATLLFGESLFERLFSEEFKIDPRPVDLLTQLLDRLESVVVAWMKGAPLKDLEGLLGTPPQRVGKCEKAREFAIRYVMNIAYAAGLICRVREAQLAEQKSSNTDMETLFMIVPLALTVLHACIRAGFYMPEQLALYNILNRDGARVGTHRKFIEIRELIPPASGEETFVDTQGRVRLALEAS